MKTQLMKLISMVSVICIMIGFLATPVSAATGMPTTIITRIEEIEEKAEDWLEISMTSVSTYNVNNLVLGYLRSFNSSYTGLQWNVVAGIPDGDFVDYVEAFYPTYDTYFTGLMLRDLATNDDIDFIHLCATIDGYVSTNNPTPDSWSGWAGDCAQLAKEIVNSNSVTDVSYDGVISTAMSWMGHVDHTMPLADILADIDGALIANAMNSNSSLRLSTALSNYYRTSQVNTRYTRFVNSFGEWYDFEAAIYNTLDPNNNYIANISLIDIMGAGYGNTTPNQNQCAAVAGTFVNYVLTEAIAEGYTYD